MRNHLLGVPADCFAVRPQYDRVLPRGRGRSDLEKLSEVLPDQLWSGDAPLCEDVSVGVLEAEGVVDIDGVRVGGAAGA